MKPLKLAQISDLHFTRNSWNPFRLFSKRLVGNLNWILNRKKSFSTDGLFALPSLLGKEGVDFTLLGGDFTTTSLPREFALGASFVESLPTPWIAVPGNHDAYTYRSYRQKHFYRYFENKSPAHFRLSTHRVEGHHLQDKWWLVALDTAPATNPTASTGLFAKSTEDHFRALLTKIPSDASILVLNHFPFFQNDVPRHSLLRAEAMEKILLEDKRIKAYLHGHSHRHTIADLQPSGLPLVLDSGCSAEEKGTWNLLSIDDTGVTIDVYRWNSSWNVERTERIAWKR